MSRCKLSSWLGVMLLGALGTAAVRPAQANEADKHSARAQTQALVDTYRKCCPVAAATTPGGAACPAVDAFFHYPSLAKKTLAPMRKVLTPRQRQRLEAAVTEIFARTAQGSGHAFCAKEPTIAGTKEVPQGVEVALEVLEEGEDVPSTFAFVWQQHDERWQVQDLLVEGGSLITDYQNQFARIRQKEGTTGLLRRVEARLKRASAQGASVDDRDKV